MTHQMIRACIDICQAEGFQVKITNPEDVWQAEFVDLHHAQVLERELNMLSSAAIIRTDRTLR
jgi:hypothetical protein